MIDAWWLAPAMGLGILGGVALTFVCAALIKTRPMDGHTYTGDHHDEADQFLRDLNNRQDTA